MSFDMESGPGPGPGPGPSESFHSQHGGLAMGGLMMLERWVDLAASGRGGLVRWSRVKAPRRAVEKAVRSYGRDPGRLVDLCRQARLSCLPASACVRGCVCVCVRACDCVCVCV